jgi:serine/threonine protein kinase
MSDSEQKNPKDQWLERLSNEPMSEDAMSDTWTRTVFVKGKVKGSESAGEQTGEVSDAATSGSDQGDVTAEKRHSDPLPDANPDALVGQIIADKYLITGFIGKGGMSSIYKVDHQQLDTVLALKLLDKNMWSDPTAVKRFKLEAQTVSRLTHPNLITYRDFGVTFDGQPYLVMDYIQGRTLGQKIKETRGIFLPTVLEIFEQLCEGTATD